MLFALPLNATSKYTTYLDVKDLYSLGFTCKKQFEVIHKNPMVIERKRQHFIQLFGALAPCEVDISLDTLINRIHKGYRLTLTQEKPWMLKFNAQGVPRLEEVKEGVEVLINEEKAAQLNAFVEGARKRLNELSQQPLSEIQSIHDYRSRIKCVKLLQNEIQNLHLEEVKETVVESDVKDTVAHLEAFIANAKKVLDELSQQPIDQKQPIHDYRNRIVRVKFLEKQIKNLKQAVKAMSSNKMLATLFGNQHLVKFSAELKNLKIFANPGVCLGRNQFVMDLGSTAIEVNGQTLPFKIQAKVNQTYSELYIRLLDAKQKEWGSMRIFRAWYQNKENSNNSSNAEYEENKLLFSNSNPKYLHLHVHYVMVEPLLDANTGDRPLLRMLTQIAMEIFAREPAGCLKVNSVYDHADVYAFMGLGAHSLFLSYLRDLILKYRDETKRWFPDPADRSGCSFSMHKLDFSKEHQTQYFKIFNNNKDPEPARVEYDPAETLTWEKYIERQPLLNAFSGPLFWPKW